MGTSSTSRGITTRTTTWLAAMPCAALLLVTGAYGCEGHSGIPGGTRGSTGQGGADQDGSAVIIITGVGGAPGGSPDARGSTNDADVPPHPGNAGPRPTDRGDGAAPPPHPGDGAAPPPHPNDAAPPPPPHPGDAAPPPPRRADAGLD